MSRVKIFVTHYTYDKPIIASDIYQPIMAGNMGRALPEGFIGDDTGDNISRLNKTYGEMTAHYWLWKNYLPSAKEEYIGLCHYRRFLDFSDISFNFNFLKYHPYSPVLVCYYKQFQNLIFDKFDETTLLSKINGFDILSTKKWNLCTMTVRAHFDYCHRAYEMDNALSVLAKVYPEYAKYADGYLKDMESYYCLCLVMKKELLANYLTWQFDILDELSKVSNWDRYEEYNEIRMPAFIMERFYNIWLRYQIDHNNLKVLELPCYKLVTADELSPHERVLYLKELDKHHIKIEPEYMDKAAARHPILNKSISLLVKRKKIYKLLGNPRDFFFDSSSYIMRFLGIFYK